MQTKGYEISKAIKEAKWLHIHYQNKDEGLTKFWVSVQDVDPERQTLFVDMFNVKYHKPNNKDLIQTWIKFKQIQKARILEGTTYDVPVQLYEKINKHLPVLDWLKYDQFDHNVLTYLKKATEHDATPYRNDDQFIDGIDEKELLSQTTYELSMKQQAIIIEDILKVKHLREIKADTAYTIKSLCLNDLTINTHHGAFVVAYYPLFYNPKKQTLSIGDCVAFNQTFFTDGFKHQLSNYIDMDPDEFMKTYDSKKDIFKNLLSSNLYKGESINTQPYILQIARDLSINLTKEYESIIFHHQQNKLNIPLTAFFGNMNKHLKRRKEPDLVVLDDKVNIDQLRVIHNALKQYITYVQGPPGTGKTQTILNVLISAFYNEETVLLAAQNNHPLNSIIDKLSQIKYKNMLVPFPVLRLGNHQVLNKALNTIKSLYERYQDMTIFEDVLDKVKANKSTTVKSLNECLSQYESRLDLIERLDVLKSINQDDAGNMRLNVVASQEINEIQKQLDDLPNITNEDALAHVQGADEPFYMWLNFMSIKHIKRLSEPKFKPLFEIIDIEDEQERVKQFKAYLKDKQNFRNLKRVFPIIVSTLHSVPKLGPPETAFDLTIIDEAGQATLSVSLTALLRSERLLLVGDPNQLNPVVTIDDGIHRRLKAQYKIKDVYDFKENSILKTMQMADQISKFVLLRYHYRSQKPIITFSNKKYYHDSLIIKTKDIKDIDTLTFYDVKNHHIEDNHIALDEVAAIKNIMKQYKDKSVGIITPFRKQKDQLEHTLGTDYKDLTIGTIHAFQGDEKDVIILSPAISNQTKKRTFDWLKNNRELINVGSTRAKETLCVVGDYQAIATHSANDDSDILELCDYVKHKKYEAIKPSTDAYQNMYQNLNAFNTHFEEGLLKTLTHMFTINRKFTVKEKVLVRNIINHDDIKDRKLVDYYFKAEFDFVIFYADNKAPHMAIELDGDEHYYDEDVQIRDGMKNRLCQKSGFKLLRIPNSYARRYQFVRELVLKMLKS